MAKVAIVGAGAVGTAIAYASQIRGVCRELALFDLNAAKVHAEVMDLNHGLQFTPTTLISGGDDLHVCADADVVVITAGAKQKPGQSRLELAAANVAICRELVPNLVAVAPAALLLVVTNPVDVVTYAVQRFSELPAHRVFGSGTVLDSSRLRYLVARRTGVAVQNVHAYIAGEHGDSEVPLWSSAAIGGVPLAAWTADGGSRLDDAVRAEIHRNVVTSAYEIIAGKGATSLAVGLAVSRVLEAVLDDECRVLPVTSRLNGVHGLSDVCLSMPAVVGRSGVRRVLATPLDDSERDQLTVSAARLRSVGADLGL